MVRIPSYDGIGKFGKCLRVTVGSRRVMERFMEALLSLDRV